MPVADDEFDRAGHIAQRVDDLVNHAKTAASQLLLDNEFVCEPMASRQVQVVDGFRCSGFRLPLRLGRLAGPGLGLVGSYRHRLQQGLQAGQGCCSTWPLGRIEGAQALQPDIKRGVQLGPQRRRLVQKLPLPVPHRGELARKRLLAGKQLVEDDPRREDVRRGSGCPWFAKGFWCHIGLVHQLHNVCRNRLAAVHAGFGKVEVRQPGGAILPNQHRARRQVAVHHRVLVGVHQRGQQVFGHAPLLIQRQRQLRARHMHGERLARHIVQNQDERLVVIGGEEIPRRDDIGVQRQLGQRPVGIGNAQGLRLALGVRKIRVGLVHPQAGRATGKGVFGAVFGVSGSGTQLFLDHPVAKARHAGRGLHHLQGMQYQALLLQNAPGKARRNSRGILEVALGVLELHHPVCIELFAVAQMGVRRGQQNGCIHINVIQLVPPRMRLGDQALHGTRVPAQLGQGRRKRRPPLGVPLAAIHVDAAARALHINQVQGMRREQREVDLKALALTLDLEVMQQGVAVWQAIPQVGDRGAFGVVDRLAYGDHFGHYLLASLNCFFNRTSSLSLKAKSLASQFRHAKPRLSYPLHNIDINTRHEAFPNLPNIQVRNR